MNPQADVLRHSRRTLLLLGALFFAPFIGAWIVYHFFPDLRPSGRTNYGELISPARPLPAFALKDGDGKPLPELLHDKWSLVYLGAAECDETCRTRLVLVRQVRLALGKNLSRLQRIYIAPDAAAQSAATTMLAGEHRGLKIMVDAGAEGQRAVDFFKPSDAQALYLVDPNGNWLMVYAGNVEPKGLLGDLKKLMRLSSIG